MLVAVAIGGVVALFDLPLSTPTVTNTGSSSWFASANTSNSTNLVGPSSVSGAFSMHWHATVPLVVQFYRSDGCLPGSTGCSSTWTLVASWSSGTGGSWNESGTVHFPFRFFWTNPGSSTGNVVLTTATVTNAAAVVSPVSQFLLLIGVGILGFIGAMAIFLGLFLRGGVYRLPPPLVSRGADDAAAIAGDSSEPDSRVY